jgi:hypothetical protein
MSECSSSTLYLNTKFLLVLMSYHWERHNVSEQNHHQGRIGDQVRCRQQAEQFLSNIASICLVQVPVCAVFCVVSS